LYFLLSFYHCKKTYRNVNVGLLDMSLFGPRDKLSVTTLL